MEKRKLAQIPREEATDEMVRFAERAAGTAYCYNQRYRKRPFNGDILSHWQIEERRKGCSVKNIFLPRMITYHRIWPLKE